MNSKIIFFHLLFFGAVVSLVAFPMDGESVGESNNFSPRASAGVRADADTRARDAGVGAGASDVSQTVRGSTLVVPEEESDGAVIPALENADENSQPAFVDAAITIEKFQNALAVYPNATRLILVHDEAGNVSIQAQDGNDLGQNQEVIDALRNMIPSGVADDFLDYDQSNSFYLNYGSTRMDPLSSARLDNILQRWNAVGNVEKQDEGLIPLTYFKRPINLKT